MNIPFVVKYYVNNILVRIRRSKALKNTHVYALLKNILQSISLQNIRKLREEGRTVKMILQVAYIFVADNKFTFCQSHL